MTREEKGVLGDEELGPGPALVFCSHHAVSRPQLDRSTREVELGLDYGTPTMTLAGQSLKFENGQWITEVGGAVDRREAQRLRRRNQQLEEENNLLRLKVDILLDMVRRAWGRGRLGSVLGPAAGLGWGAPSALSSGPAAGLGWGAPLALSSGPAAGLGEGPPQLCYQDQPLAWGGLPRLCLQDPPLAWGRGRLGSVLGPAAGLGWGAPLALLSGGLSLQSLDPAAVASVPVCPAVLLYMQRQNACLAVPPLRQAGSEWLRQSVGPAQHGGEGLCGRAGQS
uniref:Chibby family member 1, beta catenin antagonist n=1 Tax=Oryctolagus cuniculus TaxID=9986 RepID=A0A5F9C5V3_RABIT